MMTEKTAQKREAAVLRATEPYFKKVGSGLQYLKQQIKMQNDLEDKRQKAINDRIEILEQINYYEQQHNQAETNELKKQLDKIQKIISNSEESERIFENMSINCDNCGAFISPIQIVCHKCGAVSKIFPFDIDNALHVGGVAYENGISTLSENIKYFEPEYTPYSEVENQINAIKKIKTISKTYLNSNASEEVKKHLKEVYDLSDSFLNDTKNKRIEIAIAGNVKSGKSTLINALLGERMASVEPTPETSVLVKYHTTPEKNYIKVSFYSEKEWKEIWEQVKSNKDFTDNYKNNKADEVKNRYVGKESKYIEFSNIQDLEENILKWTSSSNPEYYFVNELEVGFKGEQLPNDVVLVDTPGLADKVRYRSDITEHYLKNADYVLTCVRYETMDSADEHKFLEKVSSYLQKDLKRMIIVGTQADKMNNLEDINKKQDKFSKDLLPLFDGKEGLVANHFVRVFALPQILLREWLSGNELSVEDDDLLDSALRKNKYRNLSRLEISQLQKEIEEKFGITLLNKKLEETVYAKTRKNIIKKIKEAYDKVNIEIRNIAKQRSTVTKQNLIALTNKSDEFHSDEKEIEDCITNLQQKNIEISNLIDTISSYTKESEEV